jgi:hypothetical protein
LDDAHASRVYRPGLTLRLLKRAWSAAGTRRSRLVRLESASASRPRRTSRGVASASRCARCGRPLGASCGAGRLANRYLFHGRGVVVPVAGRREEHTVGLRLRSDPVDPALCGYDRRFKPLQATLSRRRNLTACAHQRRICQLPAITPSACSSMRATHHPGGLRLGGRPSVSRCRGHAHASPGRSTREPSDRPHARSSYIPVVCPRLAGRSLPGVSASRALASRTPRGPARARGSGRPAWHRRVPRPCLRRRARHLG